jgi:hypothetical protein
MSKDNQPKLRGKQKTPPPEKPYQKNQPIWKQTTIQVLRGMIGTLETAVVKLETEAISDTKQSLNFWQYLQSGWDRFLRQFRLFLPSNVSNNLSDLTLTGIFAGILILTVAVALILFTGKSTSTTTITPIEIIPTTQPIVNKSPEPVTPKVEDKEKIAFPIDSRPAPTSTPTPVESVKSTPEPTSTPTPIVELTPEQTLIAAIEGEIKQITIPQQNSQDIIFASTLIESIQANFRSSDLTIKVNQDWYALAEFQQKQLARDIFKKSQEFDLIHLEIIDFQKKLIARSPIVGSDMVFFAHRSLPNGKSHTPKESNS